MYQSISIPVIFRLKVACIPVWVICAYFQVPDFCSLRDSREIFLPFVKIQHRSFIVIPELSLTQLFLFYKRVVYHISDIVEVKGIIFVHKNMKDEKP